MMNEAEKEAANKYADNCYAAGMGVRESFLIDAETILHDYGLSMLLRMVWWSFDPYKSESPVETRRRFVSEVEGR